MITHNASKYLPQVVLSPKRTAAMKLRSVGLPSPLFHVDYFLNLKG
jgi:hypothetical protein